MYIYIYIHTHTRASEEAAAGPHGDPALAVGELLPV